MKTIIAGVLIGISIIISTMIAVEAWKSTGVYIGEAHHFIQVFDDGSMIEYRPFDDQTRRVVQ